MHTCTENVNRYAMGFKEYISTMQHTHTNLTAILSRKFPQAREIDKL